MRRVLAVLGPTASGKSDTAIRVALELGAEVLSVDSMQVYRGMDIGTAKPGLHERRGIPHHMIDVAEPEETFSVARFRRMGRRLMEREGPPLVLAGGSGLHFRALVDPMSFAPTDPVVRAQLEETSPDQLRAALLEADPGAAAHVDLANDRRVVRAVEILQLTGESPSARAASAEAANVRRYVSEIPFTAVGLDPGPDLEDRIAQRLRMMRSGGLVDEVRRLRKRLGRTARSAVGYKEVLRLLEGKATVEEAFEAARVNTTKLARRQRTWFKRDPRILWVPWIENPEQRAQRVLEVMA